MLEAALLGQFAVLVGGRPVVVASRPAQVLLAYLLLTRGTKHRRERLAALLWPDADDGTARQNLRNALWVLNKALGAGYLVADKLAVGFDARAPHQVDALVLEAPGDDLASLLESVAAYGGELLPGSYDEWVLLERERLAAVFELKAQRLLEALLEAGRAGDAAMWAERWIATGSTPEPAYRALMAARHALGDAAGVAAAFARCCKDLGDGLGVQRSDETRALFDRLSWRGPSPEGAAEGIPTAADARVVVARPAVSGASADLGGDASSVERPPPEFLVQEDPPIEPDADVFVGCERELADLDEALARTLAGRLQVRLVAGEAGRGKSSLLAAFRRRALAAHAHVVIASGTCDAYAGSGDPFSPFREVLALLTGDVEARWRAGTLSTQQARRLWSLVPDALEALIGRGADLLDTLVASGPLLERAATYARTGRLEALETWLRDEVAAVRARGADRNRLFDAYADVVDALAVQRPLVLIVDDLHWADASSVQLFFHLARRLTGRSVLLVGAYRPEDVAAGDHPAARLLVEVVAELERTFGDVLLDLDLTDAAPDAGRAFVDALLAQEPHDVSEAFRKELLRRTGGHPLFTVELLHELRSRGGLQRGGDGSWRVGPALDWEAMPARVEGMVRARLAHVDDELRAVLAVASVEGEEFTAEVVAAAHGIEPRRLVALLGREAAGSRRLVHDLGVARVGGRRVSRYRFRHHLFQRFLYGSLGPSQRAYLHEAVGRAIESLHGSAEGAAAVLLARHYREAGLVERSVPAALAAGRRALDLAAGEEAAGHLRVGLAALEEAHDLPHADALELRLLLALGTALHATEGYASEGAGAASERARALAERVGADDERFQAAWNLWVYHVQHARIEAARTVADELLALAERTGDDGMLLQAHHSLWFTTLAQGAFDQARAHAEIGMALYDPDRHHVHSVSFGGHDPGVCARLFAARALWSLGDAEQARALVHEAQDLADRLAHPPTRVHASVFGAEVLLLDGEGMEALRLAERAHELAEDLGLPHWSAWSAILTGCARVAGGDMPDGITAIEEGLEAYRATGGELEQPVFLGRLADAYLRSGALEKARASLDAAKLLATRTGERRYDAELARVEALLQRASGRTEAAAEALDRALTIARHQGAQGFERRILATAAAR